MGGTVVVGAVRSGFAVAVFGATVVLDGANVVATAAKVVAVATTSSGTSSGEGAFAIVAVP